MAKQSLAKNKRKLITPVFHLQTKDEEEKILTKVIIKTVRKTGSLNLSGRSLTTVPSRIFKIYEFTDEDYTDHVDFSRNSDENEDSWWNFKPLNYLDFSSNQLQEIPSEIGMFESLEIFILQDNNIISLPSNIGNLKRLKKLNLSRNKLKELPDEFFNLVELEWVSLAHNFLEKIDKKLSDMVMLRHLDLSHNCLSKLPAGLGFLVRLTDLDVSNNKLIQLPPDIVNMRGLRKLDVTHNELKFLPRIGEMRRLELLFAQHNNIEELPDFEGSECVQEIYLGNNYIKTVPPAFCESLHHLKILDLRDNKIEELPSNAGSLQSLIRLDLTNNDLDSLPSSLCLLAHLQNLQLEGNKLKKIRNDVIKAGTLRIMKHLRENMLAEEIKDLNLSEDSIFIPQAQFPDKFAMRNAHTLNLSMKELKTVPEEVFKDAQWAEVSCVDLCRNKFSEFPTGLIFTKDHLKELNMSINMIREVPHFIGDFSHLMYLNLASNKLTDLPLTLSSLVYMRELVLTNNGFLDLPNCVYELKGLEILLANDNKLSAINVEGFKKLTNLAVLDLSNNSINHVPPELGLLKQLRSLEIQGNLFRQPRYTILEQGTESILAYLRDRIPTN
ncbi:leucine-rich repeat-containing protein 40-like [Coccinella septempunctata]|uniref:leucine-rich repeat-containing protein 40-like n=1 Tax=Coccinella septempunctata TaxID=41139 RepID=UPI001D085FA2|nr:leucine-rich repeat-containing protein 40-like [Coccinella septempunctata]